MNATLLKKKLKLQSTTLSESHCIRLHRAVSWLKCAEENNNNPDLQFITLWIAYNACYAIDEKHESISTEKERFSEFVAKYPTGQVHLVFNRAPI